MSPACYNSELLPTRKGSLANPTAMKEIFLSRLQSQLHLRQPKREQVGPWGKNCLSVKILNNLKWVQRPRCLFYVGLNKAEPTLFVCMFACFSSFFPFFAAWILT